MRVVAAAAAPTSSSSTTSIATTTERGTDAYERVAKSENSRLVGSLDIRNLSGYTQNLRALGDPPRADVARAQSRFGDGRNAGTRRAPAVAPRLQDVRRPRHPRREPPPQLAVCSHWLVSRSRRPAAAEGVFPLSIDRRSRIDQQAGGSGSLLVPPAPPAEAWMRCSAVTTASNVAACSAPWSAGRNALVSAPTVGQLGG